MLAAVTMDISALVVAFVGLLGVPLGLFMGEWLRRNQRSEKFVERVFERRLGAYEQLFALVQAGSTIANQVIDDDQFNAAERKSKISAVIHSIAGHADLNALYLNEEVSAHCTALFMGAEDAQDLSEEDRNQYVAELNENLLRARAMIFDDAGITKVNKVLSSINEPRISSPVIELMRDLRAKD